MALTPEKARRIFAWNTKGIGHAGLGGAASKEIYDAARVYSDPWDKQYRAAVNPGTGREELIEFRASSQDELGNIIPEGYFWTGRGPVSEADYPYTPSTNLGPTDVDPALNDAVRMQIIQSSPYLLNAYNAIETGREGTTEGAGTMMPNIGQSDWRDVYEVLNAPNLQYLQKYFDSVGPYRENQNEENWFDSIVGGKLVPMFLTNLATMGVGSVFGAGASALGGADSWMPTAFGTDAGYAAGMSNLPAAAGAPAATNFAMNQNFGGGGMDWFEYGLDYPSTSSGFDLGGGLQVDEFGNIMGNTMFQGGPGSAGAGDWFTGGLDGGVMSTIGSAVTNIAKTLGLPQAAMSKLFPAIAGAILGGMKSNRTPGPIQTETRPWNAEYFGPVQNEAVRQMNQNQLQLPEVPKLNSLPDIATDEHAKGYADSVVGAMRQNFNDPGGTMSSIRADFGDQFGSSRHQIAAGVAAGRQSQAEGLARANIMNAIYPTNLGYNKARADTDNANKQWEFGQQTGRNTAMWQAPWTNVTNAANVVTGASGRGAVSTTQLPTTPW